MPRFIDGSAEGNMLTGTVGADILAGEAGDDDLQGGAGIDEYIFHQGDGDDTITYHSFLAIAFLP